MLVTGHRFALAAVLALTACVSGETANAPAAPPDADIADYLTQNLCTDEAGAAIPGDPATCSRTRNAKPREATPYRLGDRDKAHGGIQYQRIASQLEEDGQVRVNKMMADGGGFHRSFDGSRDGFDLIEMSGDWVSIAATSDARCLGQSFSGAGEGDGWVLFPARLPERGGNRRHNMVLRREAKNLPASCPARSKVSRVMGGRINAVWTAPQLFRFESGKELLTIRSEHHAHHDLSRRNNAIEMIFFTREYGWSRWEAWQPQARCIAERGKGDPVRMCTPDNPANFLKGRCNPASAQATRGGQPWVRVDCRDTTFVEVE